MFRKKKLRTVGQEIHRAFVTMPRLQGGCVITSGLMKNGWRYTHAYTVTKELKGVLREELDVGGYLRAEYAYDGTLIVTLNFGFGEKDGRYGLVREIFYENQEGAFDGCDDEELVYNHLRLVKVRGTEHTRLEYTVDGVAPEAVVTRLARIFSHINNELDIYAEDLEEELI